LGLKGFVDVEVKFSFALAWFASLSYLKDKPAADTIPDLYFEHVI